MNRLVLAGLVLSTTSLAADVEFQPYGFILTNAHYVKGTTSPVDIPVFATSDDEKNFLITARQTRFGLKIKGPDVGKAKLEGVIEGDFWGLRGSLDIGSAQQTAPRLRLAHFKLSWAQTTLTVGQDWCQTFAPLLIPSLAHQGVPGLSSSGNLWGRLPQIRIEHDFKTGDKSKFTLSGAFLRPFGADLFADISQPDAAGGGEKSGMPFVQARGAYSMPIFEKSLVIGVSGHFGVQKYAKKDINSFGYSVDCTLPVGKKLALTGEGYVGQNLKMFGSMSGIVGKPDQSDTAEAGKTTGGWAQLWVGIGAKGGVNLGYGIENLDQDQIVSGRLKNQTIYGNYIYAFNKSFKTSIELDRISTTVRSSQRSVFDAIVVDVAGQFLF